MLFKKTTNALVVSISTMLVLLSMGCSPDRGISLSDAEIASIDSAIAARSWTIPDYPEQFLRPRTWDLQHQKLWVRFDFDEQEVIGKTELFLTSLRANNISLILDSKTTQFDSIYVIQSGQNLDFQQDSSIIEIELPKYYGRQDSLYIGMSFRSRPPNRGLYFVNPQAKDPEKPVQVWTLGQPEDNSFWFPTIDHPAERMTQEVWISVPESMETISNGILIDQKTYAGDSLRTDYWVMDQPHAPYLLALAAGDFTVTETFNHDIVFRYYTEPEYANYVDVIYQHTEEMLAFMEEKTGISYPWPKVYAQVPVRDFIAGGMENTTATFLFDGVQHDYRAAQDISNQDLIMHEMAHQWFGNLVTTKDWANLPLNEGFATYFEILFRDHIQGEDEALWKKLTDRNDYFYEAVQFRRPIISNRYSEPEDMFDTHTYQKAGLVLHMLHNYVGDEIWWSALNRYLTDYAFKAVDIDDLQNVFEQESGENLNWFFDQWFHHPGHPIIDYEASIDGNIVRLRVQQVQDTEHQPVFKMQTEAHFVSEEDVEHKYFTITELDSIYVFELEHPVTDVILDPDRLQLASYRDYVNRDQLITRLDHPSIAVRLDALAGLSEAEWTPELQAHILRVAAEDEFWGVRRTAVELLGSYPDAKTQEFALNQTLENEPEGQVRLESLFLIDDFYDDRVQQHISSMTSDTSYFVAAEAIKMFGILYPDLAYDVIAPYADDYSWRHVIRSAVAQGLAETDDIRAFNLLSEMSRHPGDHNYIRLALEALPNYYPQHDVRATAVQVYLDKISDPYFQNRAAAYQGLAKLNAREAVATLEQILETVMISDQEKQLIRTVIDEIHGVNQDTE